MSRSFLRMAIFCLFSFGNSAMADTSLVPVESYASLPKIGVPQVSPNGQNIAIKRPYDGRQTLFLYIPGHDQPFAYSSGDYADINWYEWASNERLIMSLGFPKKVGPWHGYYARTIAMDPDGTNIVGLRESRRSVTTWRGGRILSLLPEDPDHILMAIGGVAKRINIHNAKQESVVPPHEKIAGFLADGDGVVRLRWGFRDEKVRMDYRETGDERFKPLLRFEIHKDEEVYPIYFGPEPHLIWMERNVDGGRAKVMEYDTRTGEYTRTLFEHDEVDIDGLLLSGDRKRVVGAFLVDDFRENTFIDANERDLDRMLQEQFAPGRSRIISRSYDENTLTIGTSSDVHPPRFHLLNRAADLKLDLGSAYPALDNIVLSPMQPISFKARDGLEIRGYLTAPIGAEVQDLPLVVLPHGGPMARDTRGFDYQVQLLASRGFAVLQVNFRGSTGFGLQFERKGWSQWGMAMQDDITDATRWAIEQRIADPDRICIAGGSYGGYVAVMGTIKTPELFKCAASFAGVMDLQSHVRSLNRLDRDPSDLRALQQQMTECLAGRDTYEDGEFERAEQQLAVCGQIADYLSPDVRELTEALLTLVKKKTASSAH